MVCCQLALGASARTMMRSGLLAVLVDALRTSVSGRRPSCAWRVSAILAD